jgi:hypothetical protein
MRRSLITNSMYVPFTGTLDQVYNLVKKIQPQNEVEINYEDEKVIVRNQPPNLGQTLPGDPSSYGPASVAVLAIQVDVEC